MPIDSGNLALKGLDELFSTEEKRQEEQREQVQQIPIDELHPFTNHPFKVVDDEAMTRTVESIAQFGVLAPLIARPRPDGDGYEIISGHRRQFAAKMAGLETLPVIVRDMDDDAATILMVDSNLQREHMFDRLGRRDDETPFIVEWFTKQGIEVWSVNEGQQRFDTHVDKLMNYIRYWQASGESLKTSVRTRTRLEQLTGEGHYTGGTVAFGYKRVRLGRVNKKNQEVCDLVIDEAEAEIVRLIFHKYVYEGYGAQKLSHYLYEQGVVGRNNKNIPNTSIVRMIKNKGYTGYLINGAVETECPQLRIIEPELFEQAQELRQARTCERGGTSLGTSSKALLTGLVYCGHCGNRLSLTSSGRTHTYADGHTVKEVRPRYSCFYKIRHPGDCDGQSGYGVSKLDSIVEEVVRQIFAQFREVSRKKLLESVKTNDAARIQKKIKKIQKDLEAKQKELDDLKAETILVIRGVSALDKELLGTLVAEAKDALETLEKQLVQAQEEYEEATKTAKRSNYICNELFTWADVYDTANHDERRAILQQFIKEIRVRKDYEISITLNASFNQVEQLKAVSTYDGAEIFEEISEKKA